MHAKVLTRTIRLPTSVLIVKAVVLLKRDRQKKTDTAERHIGPRVTHAGGYAAGVDNKILRRIKSQYYKLDGCIVWNAHSTVLGSKRLAICATVYMGVQR